ncbi:MAG: protein translocase subunit SecD [Candidatus Taylorbacteria bacterium]|nr:protein translocase subunit SecD [Candidatus Taylorbacteria bacterium]
MRNSYLVIIIIVASLLLFVFVWPQAVNRIFKYLNVEFSVPEKPFILGLDMLGGAHLLYEADLSVVEEASRVDAMDGIRDVIERRVNFFGVSEPVVQVSGDNRLIIELAGITDVNQAIQMIGETPFLEFKEEAPNYEELLAEFQKKVDSGQATEIDSLVLNDQIFVSSGLNGKHIKRAQVAFDPQTGQPQVSLELNDEGAKLFGEITKKNIGKRVAIYLDGLPISVPVVQTEISDGQAVISGGFTPQEAKLLAIRLNSGALPVPINLISQQTIGASLGKESLSKSLKAGLYSLIFVAVFMIVLYRLPGVVSIFALFVYVLIVLSIYKLMPVTLTLAGIAGFILTLGMAVDANVLIFARMKEELASGKTVAGAIKEGFSRAWLSIRDSHITTLLSAFVLYVSTTSIVKGFALTLGIGAIISLFTATVVTRSILLLFTGPKFGNKRWLF